MHNIMNMSSSYSLVKIVLVANVSNYIYAL